MEIPVRCICLRPVRLPMLASALLCVLAGACTTVPRTDESLGLEPRRPQFSQGRVTVILVDEQGMTMSGMKVDMSWQEPYFYKTSAFTNRHGEVSFSGIPEVAEVSVDHPGGNYTSTLLVPQSGRPELRLFLDTHGGSELLRQRERERLAPRGMVPAGAP